MPIDLHIHTMGPIENALDLKKQLDSLRPISRDNELRIMQKFRLDWNYHSNNMEGNSLTFGETKALILFGITAQGKPLKDHLEITGHNEAIEWVMDVVKDSHLLTETFIRQLHILLLKEAYEVRAITPDGLPTTKQVELGRYKKLPNHVLTPTGEVFRFASPEETPAKMEELIKWFRETESGTDSNPILIASEFHYRFIRIHPFDDGNGRTARILMNFILMKNGFPPVVIKTQDKANYLSALRLADAGMIAAFVDYIASNLVNSLELMIRGAKGLSIEDPDDFDKELELLSRRLKSSVPAAEKTDELIEGLLAESVQPLFSKFIEANKKFDRFYFESRCSIVADSKIYDPVNDLTEIFKAMRVGSLRQIQIRYHFGHLRNPLYGSLTYVTSISLRLNPENYSISNGAEKDVNKKYGQQLFQAEIEQIVQHVMNEHKNYIEELAKSL